MCLEDHESSEELVASLLSNGHWHVPAIASYLMVPEDDVLRVFDGVLKLAVGEMITHGGASVDSVADKFRIDLNYLLGRIKEWNLASSLSDEVDNFGRSKTPMIDKMAVNLRRIEYSVAEITAALGSNTWRILRALDETLKTEWPLMITGGMKPAALAKREGLASAETIYQKLRKWGHGDLLSSKHIHDHKTRIAHSIEEDRKKALTIRDLFDDGKNLDKIKMMTGSSISFIRKTLSSQLASRIVECRGQKMSWTAVGKALGTSGRSARRWAAELGIEPYKVVDLTNIPASKTGETRELFSDNRSIRETAKAVKLPQREVCELVRSDLESELIAHFTDGGTQGEIATMIDVTREMVSGLMKDWDLASHSRLTHVKHELNSDAVLLRAYNLATFEDIGREFSVSAGIISHVVRAKGFPVIPSPVLRARVDGDSCLHLSDTLQDVLTGELLADGHLRLSHQTGHSPDDRVFPSLAEYSKSIQTAKEFQSMETLANHDLQQLNKRFRDCVETIIGMPNASFILPQAEIGEAWTRHVSECFVKEGLPAKVFEFVDRVSGDKRIEVRTESVIQLGALRGDWYKGHKIVPRNIEITPDTLLHLHMGDGCTDKDMIVISTHSFNVDDVKFLVIRLREDAGVHAMPKRTNRPSIAWQGEMQHGIGIYRTADMQRYLEFIGQASPRSVKIAKRVYPWKFDRTLRKRDIVE